MPFQQLNPLIALGTITCASVAPAASMDLATTSSFSLLDSGEHRLSSTCNGLGAWCWSFVPEQVKQYGQEIGLACLYLVGAVIVFVVGYLGAYLIATKSTGAALGVILGVMLPILILGLYALRNANVAPAALGVAGISMGVAMVAAGAKQRGARRRASMFRPCGALTCRAQACFGNQSMR